MFNREKRYSENLDWNFRSVSRQKRPTWGNRFTRDTNDLVYKTSQYNIKEKIAKARPAKALLSPEKAMIDNEIGKYEYSPFQKRSQVKSSQSMRNLNSGLDLRKYISTANNSRKQKRQNQQTAASTQKKIDSSKRDILNGQKILQQYGLQNELDNNNQNINKINQYNSLQYANSPTKKQINLLGLSQFEFSKTIEGKLLMKSNLHLDFSKNKTQKINNINKIQYDRTKQIVKPSDIIEKQKYEELKKVHSFRSYTPHKLFYMTNNAKEDGNGCGRGGMLDAFYDIGTTKHYETTHPKTTKRNVDYSKMTPRPDLPLKLGTNLQYKVEKINALSPGNSKRPLFEICKSERKMVFNRQVISPRLGCYR